MKNTLFDPEWEPSDKLLEEVQNEIANNIRRLHNSSYSMRLTDKEKQKIDEKVTQAKRHLFITRFHVITAISSRSE